MERIPNAVYTKEFRDEAVRMITEGGITVMAGARRLSVPKSTISYWVRADRQGTLATTRTKSLTAEEMELARLKRELVEVKMERDFLKKQQRMYALQGASQKSRSQVRVHEEIPAPLYPSLYVPCAPCIPKRLLPLHNTPGSKQGWR